MCGGWYYHRHIFVETGAVAVPFSIFFFFSHTKHVFMTEHNSWTEWRKINLEKRGSKAKKAGYFTLEPKVHGRIVSRLDSLNRSCNRIILTNMESGYIVLKNLVALYRSWRGVPPRRQNCWSLWECAAPETCLMHHPWLMKHDFQMFNILCHSYPQ